MASNLAVLQGSTSENLVTIKLCFNQRAQKTQVCCVFCALQVRLHLTIFQVARFEIHPYLLPDLLGTLCPGYKVDQFFHPILDTVQGCLNIGFFNPIDGIERWLNLAMNTDPVACNRLRSAVLKRV